MAQLVLIPTVPHAYRDVTFCTVELLCFAPMVGLEPPSWRPAGMGRLARQAATSGKTPAGTGKAAGARLLEQGCWSKAAGARLLELEQGCWS